MTTARMDAFRAGIALLIAGALLAPAVQAGEESAGTRVATFLSLGAGPAVEGMAGATVGYGQSLQSAAWNVAALGSLPGTRASFAHTGLIDGASQEWASFGGRLRGGATRWGLSGLYRDDGEYEARDASNQFLGTEHAFDLALTLQLARPIGSHLVAGGAVKYVGEHFGALHGNGAAFDAGLQWQMGGLGLGATARNFGGGMHWAEGGRWPMPATFAMGASFEHQASGLRFALDLVSPADYWRSVRFGTEYRVGSFAAIRAGYRRDQRAPRDEHLSGPAFGIGAGVAGGWLDYAFSTGAGDVAEHRIALTLGARRDADEPLGPKPPAQDAGDGHPSR